MHFTTPIGQLIAPDNHLARQALRDTARPMPLKGFALSGPGLAFVSHLVAGSVRPFRATTKRVGCSMLSKYRKALSALLADLLAAAEQGCWAKRSTNNAAMADYPGSRLAFDDVRRSLVASGYIDELRGYVRLKALERGQDVDDAYSSTCFRPTPALLSLASDFGVELDDYRQHFTPSGARPWVPGDPVEARGHRKRKTSPVVLIPIHPDDEKAHRNSKRMADLNAYLIDGQRVSGILFGGLRRVFNDADRPGFDWQWGGRFYSMPNWTAYEQLKGKAVRRRQEIRLDGQTVAEVDLSAAHLTILHGLLGEPLDPRADPYDFPGFDRDGEVKEWIKKALGAGNVQWGGKDFDQVREAIVTRYPLLRGLGSNGISPLDLQYHESEIILMALEALRDRHGVAALPIHDGLIVPEAHQVLAQGVLLEAFQRYFRDTLRAERIPTPRVGLVSYRSP